jgi:putative acetyltransferase
MAPDNPKPQPVTLSTAKPNDAADIVGAHYAAVHSSAAAYYTADILNNWSNPVSPERIARFVKTVGDPDKIVLVAKCGDQLAGFGLVEVSAQYLGAIYVHPDFGGLGVGSRILGQLERVAMERGVAKLRLDASLNARAFYEKHGYRVLRSGTHELDNGVSMACLKMKKTLKRDPAA